jgi:hypothetical protein
MKKAGLSGNKNGLYLTRKILVGAGIGEWNNTTFGNLSAAYPVYTMPRWFSSKRHNETGNGFRPGDM